MCGNRLGEDTIPGVALGVVDTWVVGGAEKDIPYCKVTNAHILP